LAAYILKCRESIVLAGGKRRSRTQQPFGVCVVLCAGAVAAVLLALVPLPLTELTHEYSLCVIAIKGEAGGIGAAFTASIEGLRAP
jgi:hypothetical protein